jgi:hypothetical protein
MAATDVLVNYTFRDSKGQTAHVRLYINQGGAASLQVQSATTASALAALTNATVRDPLADATLLDYGTTAQFASVEDKATLSFVDTKGDIARCSIPAPKSTIFLADLETVDATVAGVATFIGLWTSGNIKNRDGQSTWEYLGGIRNRRRTQRRFNIWTKNPALTDEGE